MALKDLAVTKEDLRAIATFERRRAGRFEQALRDIVLAKAAPADRLRELAAKAVRKKSPSFVRRRKRD